MEPQGTLQVAMSEVGPAVFNNRDATYATLRFLMTTVGESMFQNNLDGQTAGRLVKDWSIESNSEGGVTYTFNLQPGVKWHDNLGDWGEFNADDFIYNVNLVTDDKSVHAIKAGMLRAYNCDECQLIKVDDLTVQLKRPTETFEVFWYTKQPAGSILSLESKAHVDAVGEEQAILDPVYSGSWEIIDYATGEFYEMRGVRDHWRKTPEWETLYWQGIAEESTRIANFLTEKIDTGKFLLEGIRELKENGNPDHKFIAFPDALTNRVQIFGMIHTGPDDLDGGQPGQPADTHVPDADGDIRARLDDGYFDCSHAFIPCDRDVNSDEWQKALKVRLALNYAIDRQKLVNNLSYGEGEAAYISNWGGHRLRFDQQGLNELVYSHDPAKAKQLMEEAGYTDGFKVDMVHPDLFPSGKPGAQAVCVMWLEAINVQCNERNEPYSSFRPTIVVRNYQGFYSHGLGQQIEPLWLMQLFYDVSGGFNYGFEHPDFQDMIDHATSLNDDDARFKATADMSRWLFDNAMLVNMYSEPQILPIGPRIDVWEVLPGPIVDFNSYENVPHRQ
jgi:ABC-type transport system substrate-binding protein